MKHLLFETGGRPLNNDDFVTFQDEIYYAVNGQLSGFPACVVAGCDVTAAAGGNYDIAAGLVYLDGEIRRFEGVTGVALPQELYSDAFTTTEQRAYQVGGSKDTMGEALVLARPFDAALAVDKVKVVAEGVLRVSKVMEAQFRQVCDVKMMADFPAEYDATGRGKYGTRSYGWAHCNGLNNTPNMGGRVGVGFDSGVNDYNATRKTGGEAAVTLQTPQLPSHSHTMQQAGDHSHAVGTVDNPGSIGNGRALAKTDSNNGGTDNNRRVGNAGNHTHSIDTTGDGLPHNNMQPYAVLAFFMWVGI